MGWIFAKDRRSTTIFVFSRQGVHVEPGSFVAFVPMSLIASSAVPKLGQTLCEDRKAFFSHLHPRPFTLNIFRVFLSQGTLILANYTTDQLQEDLKRDDEVRQGNMTHVQANEIAKEWEEVGFFLRTKRLRAQ